MLLKVKVYRNLVESEITNKENLILVNRVINLAEINSYEERELNDEPTTVIYHERGIDHIAMSFDEFNKVFCDMLGIKVYESTGYSTTGD